MKPKTEKDVRREAQLRALFDRQTAPGEQVAFGGAFGSTFLAVTDRRAVVSTLGMLGGEAVEWVPLGAIAAVSCTFAEGRLSMMTLAIAGRTWGDLVLSGDDLSPFNAALAHAMRPGSAS